MTTGRINQITILKKNSGRAFLKIKNKFISNKEK
jgi:hypothetical protein